MREFIVMVLIIFGTALMTIAAVGMVRMPDLYLRMSAATKAATLGAGLNLLAVAVYFGEFGTTSRALAIAIFLLLTAPVAAHMLGRAAYVTRVPLWDGTKRDELEGRYDNDDDTLESFPITPEEISVYAGENREFPPHGK